MYIHSNPTSCDTVIKRGIVRCFTRHPPNNITCDTPPLVTNGDVFDPIHLASSAGPSDESSMCIQIIMIHESGQYMHTRSSSDVVMHLGTRDSINKKPMLLTFHRAKSTSREKRKESINTKKRKSRTNGERVHWHVFMV